MNRIMTVPDVVAPPAGNPRFPLVDSLRAIAALSVIASHVVLVALGTRVPGILGALGSGVTIFFVISGFLLYRPYVAARLAGRTGPRLIDFVRRRALRIIPAYWLALTVLSIYPGVAGNFGHDSWIYYGLLQNWFPRLQTHGLPQAWSLSVEVTWYALLPILACTAPLATRAVRRRSPVAAELVLLLALASVRLIYEPLRSPSLDTAFYYLDWFLVGMGLAVLSASGRPGVGPDRVVRAIERHPDLCWLAAIGVYLTFAARLAHHSPTFVNHLQQGLFAVLVVFPAVFTGSGAGVSRAVLRNRLLAWLGLISYGLYLWHVPIVLRLGRASFIGSLHSGKLAILALTTLAITVACATLSYYCLERPLLRLKHSRTGPALLGLRRRLVDSGG
jgi:peptidoglycan/LPS O-acetylase OafA/YrhL